MEMGKYSPIFGVIVAGIIYWIFSEIMRRFVLPTFGKQAGLETLIQVGRYFDWINAVILLIIGYFWKGGRRYLWGASGFAFAKAITTELQAVIK